MTVFRNTSALWGAAFARALADCGTTRAFVSPGSRSTPLTAALAREPRILTTPVLDERSAAFLALGYARATRRPVLLVCTSGTAAANYLPAVVEAWHSQVPLLVCTADRPPGLRNCGAGQTIEQRGIYGPHTVWQCEAPLPSAAEQSLDNWRELLRQAWHRALEHSGPVHLNIPLCEPLAPGTPETGFVEREAHRSYISHETDKSCGAASDFLPTSPAPVASGKELLEWASRYERGIIVAGAPAAPREQARYAAAALRLAERIGWPLLADALNPARHRVLESTAAVVCGSYEAVLRNSSDADRLHPDAVLQLDQLPTSKTLRTWLGATPLPTFLLSPGGRNLNPLHTHHRLLPHSVADFDWSTAAALSRAPDWADAWRTADHSAADRLAATPDDSGPGQLLFEDAIPRILARHLPKRVAVFIANSMPVRDAESFWPVQNTCREIYSNRGVNGIDGTLGTALGTAEGAGMPTVLFTGDLSLLHDSNAFLTAQNFSGSLTIVLVNNNGGGIFNNLPVSRENPDFERFWGTPQNMDFARLAAAHGISHERIESAAALAAAIRELPGQGVRILEIRTDRSASAGHRAALLQM
jgi:2-succinyl-5-enolpyruvyl-6-hydroxy-3-cyclohexene-1-carboxylate synthase